MYCCSANTLVFWKKRTLSGSEMTAGLNCHCPGKPAVTSGKRSRISSDDEAEEDRRGEVAILRKEEVLGCLLPRFIRRILEGERSFCQRQKFGVAYVFSSKMCKRDAATSPATTDELLGGWVPIPA